MSDYKVLIRVYKEYIGLYFETSNEVRYTFYEDSATLVGGWYDSVRDVDYIEVKENDCE